MKTMMFVFGALSLAALSILGFGGRAEAAGGKILVAYFSYQGHTAGVAREIAAQTGGDLFEIKPTTPYPAYDECLEVAKAEKNNNARPAFVGNVENMADYDVVFVGYPIWWYDAPMIVLTFLEGSDLSGKTVIPFATSGGSPLSDSLDSVRASAAGATVGEGLLVGDESEIAPWLARIGYAK
ncbi:MAG: flavodoxin [Schwartzia sp.]|nr:flavodoxin [Schwartzia sp. (in: firmicutes)]